MPASEASHHDPAVDAYVREQPGELGEICAMLVELIRRTVADHTEQIHHGVPWFWVDGQPLCYFAAYSDHVNLGFRHGAKLDNSEGLLEGSGASMRHVKLIGPKAVPKASIVKLLKQATKVRE